MEMRKVGMQADHDSCVTVAPAADAVDTQLERSKRHSNSRWTATLWLSSMLLPAMVHQSVSVVSVSIQGGLEHRYTLRAITMGRQGRRESTEAADLDLDSRSHGVSRAEAVFPRKSNLKSGRASAHAHAQSRRQGYS